MENSAPPLFVQRLEALAKFKAGFLAKTSHELRAPINQIIGLHQLILEDLCEDPAEERQFLRQSFEAAQQVLKNLDLLISISKLDVGLAQPELQPVELKDLWVQVELSSGMLAKNRNCRLILSDPADKVLWSDIQWLVQALTLLIEGAILAESRQIEVAFNSNGNFGGTLSFLADGPSVWQPTASVEPIGGQPEGAEPEVSKLSKQPREIFSEDILHGFSSAFSKDLAQTILSALGAQVELLNAPAEAQGGTQVIVTFHSEGIASCD